MIIGVNSAACNTSPAARASIAAMRMARSLDIPLTRRLAWRRGQNAHVGARRWSQSDGFGRRDVNESFRQHRLYMILASLQSPQAEPAIRLRIYLPLP